MIWWYEDIFINRSSNLQIEQQTFKSKNRSHTMKKGYAKLKTSIQSVIEYLRNRRLRQHSYRVLSRLDDYHLADIGLINEDLYLLSRGTLPQRFSQTNVDKTISAELRLISTKPVAAQKAKDPFCEPALFDKAA